MTLRIDLAVERTGADNPDGDIWQIKMSLPERVNFKQRCMLISWWRHTFSDAGGYVLALDSYACFEWPARYENNHEPLARTVVALAKVVNMYGSQLDEVVLVPFINQGTHQFIGIDVIRLAVDEQIATELSV